jgi:YVTN family beta-propeller protein
MNHRSALAAAALVLGSATIGCNGNGNDNKQPGPPTTVAISAGDQQQGTVGQPLPAPIAVKVSDAKGIPVPAQSVEFTVISGSGNVDHASVTTNSAGIAFANWTLGTVAGSAQQAQARLLDITTGALVGSVVFNATAKPGQPTQIAATAGNGQSAFANQRLADSVRVVVRDTYGNAVPNAAVAFAVVEGGGSASPAAATTRADGTAAAAWTVGGPYGAAQTLRATATGVATPVTFVATILRPVDGTSTTLGSRPYALAISHDIVYVGRLDAGLVTRFNGTSTTPAASIAVGDTPTELAFNAAGTKAYVTNQFSQNIGIIDVATNAQTATIPVTGNPFVVIVSPDGNTLYVTTNADFTYKIDIASKTVTGSIATSQTANSLVLNSDGSKLYISTRDGGSVMEVRTSDMALLQTFSPGGRTQQVVLSPDNSEMYVVTEGGGLFVYNIGTGALTQSLSNLGDGAWSMAVSPDGSKLWVGILYTGEVKVFDRATRALTKTWYVGGTPRRIGFLSNGTAVVANEQGYVTWLQ